MYIKYVKMCSIVLTVLLVSLSRANPVPESTTARSTAHFGDTIKQLTSQLMEINSTSPDIVTLDTRTPPRVKQHAKNKLKHQETFENSHAGVAIPMDEDAVALEETTKKLNFYKIEKPTTNSGLSTWILLSGKNGLTTKPTTKKPVVKPTNDHQNNATVMVEPHKIIKPIFKKRITTTRPTTTTTTEATKGTTKLTKIKASEMGQAVVNKKSTTVGSTTTTRYVTRSTTNKPASTNKANKEKTSAATKTTTATTSTMKPIIITDKNVTLILNSSSTSLPVEAKNTETELKEKTKRPSSSNKRKKNKNRRRRPSEKGDTNQNSTNVDKVHKNKEKPMGTQIYNYLSREVMPTVGVGLVGLMVTAGLASYFLYPFGVARRSYDVDRKDREGGYYYNDEYSGGMLEEEAIGKVIAGMPSNSLFGNTYKTPTSRHSNSNSYYNLKNQPVSYNKNVMENTPEPDVTAFTPQEQQQFVVGNVPTEEATPVAVPEHGPRSLNFRKKRQVKIPEDNQKDNEILGDYQTTAENPDVDTSTSRATTRRIVTTSTRRPSHNTTAVDQKFTSFMHMFKELLHLKVNLGLQLIKNATQAVSTYVSHVQRRLDEHYTNYTMKIH